MERADADKSTYGADHVGSSTGGKIVKSDVRLQKGPIFLIREMRSLGAYRFGIPGSGRGSCTERHIPMLGPEDWAKVWIYSDG